MKSIKEECHHYSLLKSHFKVAEVENENFKVKLRKLQKDCLELNSRIVSINWKIQQAKFILGCEKKKHSDLYEIMKKAENKHEIEAGKSEKGNAKFIDYLLELEKKKNCLVMQKNQEKNK